MKRLSLISTVVLLLPQLLLSQFSCPGLLPGAQERIYQDIDYLASDDLQGRQPGNEGAELAAAYIEAQFEETGLQPMMEEGYRQIFSIPSQVKFHEGNKFTYDGTDYVLKKDFFPAQWSDNGSASAKTVYVKFGITAPELEYDDYEKLKPKKLEGKIFVMDISSPDGIHPHSKYVKYHDLGERINLARKKGAAGVILTNLQGMASDMTPNFKKIHNKNVPVVFISNNDLAKDIRNKEKVSFSTRIEEQRVLASNLIGMINNEAPTTVIIGAHYDHLGWGAENSLFSGDEPKIHNGADDNASGVAGLLELARNIKKREDFNQHNYLFAAFSGEEMGLLGSSFFVDNMKKLRLEPRFMLNMDMIGRLEDHQLAVNGVGTSPHWGDLIREKGCLELKVKTSASGVGPSDHTNFYYEDIPVLHFFTGTHEDYHKPSDDVEKINIDGEAKVLSYILGLLQETNNIESFTFSPTKDESTKAPKFSVTLGVMPDYMYQKEGMRIDGVTEGKPASRAGLKKGDIVVQMGEIKVVDMMSYMKALSQFEKGDTTELRYKREGETFTTKVEF